MKNRASAWLMALVLCGGLLTGCGCTRTPNNGNQDNNTGMTDNAGTNGNTGTNGNVNPGLNGTTDPNGTTNGTVDQNGTSGGVVDENGNGTVVDELQGAVDNAGNAVNDTLEAGRDAVDNATGNNANTKAR